MVMRYSYLALEVVVPGGVRVVLVVVTSLRVFLTLTRIFLIPPVSAPCMPSA